MTSGHLFSVRIKRSAEKEMDSLPKSAFDRIAESICMLETDPRPHGSRKLRGLEQYRLRVGTYRILYTVDDRHHIVEIIAVGHRRDVYR